MSKVVELFSDEEQEKQRQRRLNYDEQKCLEHLWKVAMVLLDLPSITPEEERMLIKLVNTHKKLLAELKDPF